jgi:hypothetical protein
MLLYICSQCGHWQDLSLAVALGNVFAGVAQALAGKPLETPANIECPDGHGAMTLVQPTDRIALRTEVETTLTDEKTGIVMVIQPDTPESWRRAAIEMFTENGEEEPK